MMGGYGGFPQSQPNNNMMGGGGGGGFNNGSPAVSNNNNQFGSAGGGGGSFKKAGQSIRSVSIKQVLESAPPQPDNNVQIDGRETHQVSICGRVQKVTVNANFILYTIEDSTGQVDVKKFVDSKTDDDEGGNSQGNSQGDTDGNIIEEGGYVKVVGRIKVFGNKKTVDAFNMRTVKTIDEISYHILSIVHAHLSITNPMGNPARKNAAAMQGNGAVSDSTGFGTAFGQGQIADGNYTAIQNQILSLFQQASHVTEGGDIKDIIYRMRGSGTEDQIRADVQHLCAEGALYSTLDEEHFKLTGQ